MFNAYLLKQQANKLVYGYFKNPYNATELSAVQGCIAKSNSKYYSTMTVL